MIALPPLCSQTIGVWCNQSRFCWWGVSKSPLQQLVSSVTLVDVWPLGSEKGNTVNLSQYTGPFELSRSVVNDGVYSCKVYQFCLYVSLSLSLSTLSVLADRNMSGWWQAHWREMFSWALRLRWERADHQLLWTRAPSLTQLSVWCRNTEAYWISSTQ